MQSIVIKNKAYFIGLCITDFTSFAETIFRL